MMHNIKIATWNVCLGLASKKDLVKKYIQDNNIDVCCLQETELNVNLNTDLLTFPGYSIEVESNDNKQRVAVYVSNRLNYRRRNDLEGSNNHIIIIDLIGGQDLRIMTIYRTFKPFENMTAREKFEIQLNLVKNAMSKNTIFLGDFNIDYAKKFDITYSNKHLFDSFDNILSHLGLFQHVNFATWQRLVNGSLKESYLDHIYTNNPTLFSNIQSVCPIFGDHLLVIIEFLTTQENENITWKRDWRFYNPEILSRMLSEIDWHIDACNVQQFRNLLENKLINVIDVIAPYAKFSNNEIAQTNVNTKIKTLLNARKNLLKKFKLRPNFDLKAKIKSLDSNIKNHFYQEKRKRVRRGILPGNSKSLWAAVRIAKDQNVQSFPKIIYENNVKISDSNVPDTVALFFENKVKRLVRESVINPDIYNGKRKIEANNSFFMGRDAILDCVASLKVKNAEGYDRIPQRVIKDGINHLIAPLSMLFKLIYETKLIPDQWKIAKVTPIPKKGSKNELANYRPISNLCSMSKIYEKLILKRVIELQEMFNVDFTGNQQHGFKKNKSTATAGLVLQSIIADHVDINELVGMASLDLSAAFDTVNIDLLIERIKILGLPTDVVDLVELWLKGRSFYVSIDGINSLQLDLVCGTVQGSILGPILYAIYVTPLFDLYNLTNFADDNFIVRWNSHRGSLIVDLESSLMNITKWLRGSGLAVNESKTELCLFHRLDQPSIAINLFNSTIISKNNERSRGHF